MSRVAALCTAAKTMAWRRNWGPTYSAIVACSLFWLLGVASAIAQTPQFVVHAVRIKALDETGWDWLGSDEPYVVYANFESNRAASSSTFSDVDSGESRDIHPEDSCVYPLYKCDQGTPNLHFGVAIWESDHWGSGLTYCGLVGMVSYYVGHCIGDNLIGRRELTFSQAILEGALPKVGMSREFRINPRGGDGGSYEFTFRVTRLPNVERHIWIQLLSGGGKVVLSWSGTSAANIDVYRNSAVLKTVANAGIYTDKPPAGLYTYRICEAGTTSICSTAVRVKLS